EAAGVRNRVVATQIQARRVEVERGRGGAEGPDDQMGLVERQRVHTLADHLHGQPARGDLGVERVVAGQGEAEGIETGTQVGAGGGNPDANDHASSRATATAIGSTGTGSTSCMPSSAVSGSLRPCPVTVQTTREPAGRRPSAALASRP